MKVMWRPFMKKMASNGYYDAKVIYFKRKVYKKLMPELNNMIRTAKMLGYEVELSTDGGEVMGSFVYTIKKGEFKYKLGILSVDEIADRVVAVINGEDYVQILDSKSEESDWVMPIQKVIEEL